MATFSAAQIIDKTLKAKTQLNVYKLPNAIPANKIGIIQKGGAWYSFDFLGDDPKKCQGLETARQLLIDNPEWLEQLENQIKTLL